MGVQRGERGYRLALWSLLCGTALGAAGIWRGVDLIGLSAYTTGMIGAALGTTAWRAHRESRAATGAKQP